MGTTKPVRWTSPANAWAVGAQLIAFMIPVLAVAEAYQPIALEAISVPLADMWQWLLFVAAGVALAASVTMQLVTDRAALMQALVRLEGVATLILAVCMLGLWAALAKEYGFGANPLTQLLVFGLGVAAVARVAQIIVELWKYRRALRVGETATVEALAQPKES